MSHLRDAIARVVDATTAAGMRVTADPRSVNPPGVLVEASTTQRRTRDSAQVELLMRLIAPGPPTLDSLWALDDMAAMLTPALDDIGMSWTSGRIGVFAHPGTGELLHCYELNVSTTTGV